MAEIPLDYNTCSYEAMGMEGRVCEGRERLMLLMVMVVVGLEMKEQLS